MDGSCKMLMVETARCAGCLLNGMGFKGGRELWMPVISVNKSKEAELG